MRYRPTGAKGIFLLVVGEKWASVRFGAANEENEWKGVELIWKTKMDGGLCLIKKSL